MQGLQERIRGVEVFLWEIKRGIEVEVVPIRDDYGPTADDGLLEALVGSRETEAGCRKGYCNN
jgi:phosphopantetheine adenylyltransferase